MYSGSRAGISMTNSLATTDLQVSWEAFGTEEVGNPTSSIALYVLPATYSWNGSWELKRDIFVEIQSYHGEVVAITYLTVQEYGVGNSFEDAILDLLTSLQDYYMSLMAREKSLGPPGVKDLEILRSLIQPKSTSNRGY